MARAFKCLHGRCCLNGRCLEFEAYFDHAILAGLSDVKRVLRFRAGEAVRDDGASVDLARDYPVQRLRKASQPRLILSS